MTPNWVLRPAVGLDAHWIAELRAVALRADLERLGRFDPIRVRQRFLSAFEPALTKVVLVDGQEAGSIAVRPDADSLWIEHFYVAADLQGRGVGSQVPSAAAHKTRESAYVPAERLAGKPGAGAL